MNDLTIKKILLSILLIAVLPFTFGFIYGSASIDLEYFQDVISMFMLGVMMILIDILTSPITWLITLIIVTVKFVTNDKY